MEDFQQYYPPKPKLVKKEQKRHLSITLLSIIIFVSTFLFILDDYVLILLFLGVILLHELGHFIAMKLFDYKDLNMLFIPFLGAMVSGKKKHYSQIESAVMILAGPLPGIILGISLLLLGWLQPAPFSIQLGVILLLINVLNLIPVDPLDGGQLMRVLFFNRYELAQLIFTISSSLLIAVSGIIVDSWLIIIFGLLLGFRVKNRHKLFLIRTSMREEAIPYEINYEDLSNKSYAAIQEIVLLNTPILNKIKEEVGGEDEEFEQIMANEVDGVLLPPTKRDASFWFKLVILMLWGGAIIFSIYAVMEVGFNTIVNAFQN